VHGDVMAQPSQPDSQVVESEIGSLLVAGVGEELHPERRLAIDTVGFTGDSLIYGRVHVLVRFSEKMLTKLPTETLAFRHSKGASDILVTGEQTTHPPTRFVRSSG